MDELLYFGDAVKALGGGKVGGYLVRFSTANDPDLARDFFTRETDYDLQPETKTAIYFDHGLDPVIKKRVLGRASMKVDEVGVWVEGVLEMRDDYERSIYDLAEKGKLGWSSGTAPHLVERKKVGGSNQIIRWPLGLDASLTPTPCEFRNAAVSLKRYTAERAVKNVFEQAVEERSESYAERARDLYSLTETLLSLMYQLQWVAMSAEGTDVQIDLEGKVEEILAGFAPAARTAALRMVGLGGEASAKSAGAASSTNNSYGKLDVSLPLVTHSKAVRDAARGLLVRMQELHEQRQREGKSRTLNDHHTQTAEDIASDLEAAAKAARGLASDVKSHESMRRARVEYQRTVARALGAR
ncbi:MAG TPA: hypothetical protein VGX48_18650 [Pyrinomonadaceae bacterium]|jgi:hypothetical protein|nr:hypothetical protein [Pyrinomonadaceae bacterium]